MFLMKRPARTLLFSLAIVAQLFGAASKKPKLVLAIVVDQFRYDYLLRLLEHGAVFHDAHYLHAATVTAVGHSTFLSGAPPSVSGIIANEWYDRETGQTVTSVFDPRTKLVGGIRGRPGASPRRMLVSTVGDELKMRAPASKVNKEQPYSRYIGASWLPFDAKDASAKPFCTMVSGAEIRFCGSLEATP